MKFGWCLACRERTGTRKFRKLVNGICAECQRKAGILPVKTPKPANRQLPKPKSIKPSNARDKEKLLEEKQLLSALSQIQARDSWISVIATQLGWTKERTRTVGRRLRRKGARIPPVSASYLILQELWKAQNPLSAYQIAENLPFNAASISHILLKLAEQGVVKVIRRAGFPNLYFFLPASRV